MLFPSRNPFQFALETARLFAATENRPSRVLSHLIRLRRATRGWLPCNILLYPQLLCRPAGLNVPLQGPFEIEDAVPQAEWDYDQLCTYLGDPTEMMARLEVLSTRQESEASPVVPAVPSRTATALER